MSNQPKPRKRCRTLRRIASRYKFGLIFCQNFSLKSKVYFKRKRQWLQREDSTFWGSCSDRVSAVTNSSLLARIREVKRKEWTSWTSIECVRVLRIGNQNVVQKIGLSICQKEQPNFIASNLTFNTQRKTTNTEVSALSAGYRPHQSIGRLWLLCAMSTSSAKKIQENKTNYKPQKQNLKPEQQHVPPHFPLKTTHYSGLRFHARTA